MCKSQTSIKVMVVGQELVYCYYELGPPTFQHKTLKRLQVEPGNQALGASLSPVAVTVHLLENRSEGTVQPW